MEAVVCLCFGGSDCWTSFMYCCRISSVFHISGSMPPDSKNVNASVGGGVALRGSFLIDEHGNVRHEIKNDLPLGRNVDEMLRLLDALDHHNNHGEVCPAGWMKGKSGMNPSDEGMRDYLANNTEEL